MRNIFVGIIGAALLGLAVAACTGSNHGASAITAPSAVTTTGGVVGATAANDPKECNNCTLTATAISYATWSGTTTATTTPNNGHHGTLTMTFSPGLVTGATLTWSGFNTGNKDATCYVMSDPQDADLSAKQTVNCADGSTLVVHPQGNTTYTLWDTKNNGNSQDNYQFKTVNVTVDTTRAFSATWHSNMGAADADANYAYNGTVTGPLNALTATAEANNRCGLGGGGTAKSFNASMSMTDSTHLSGTYSGIDCTIDTGSFSLTKQ